MNTPQTNNGGPAFPNLGYNKEANYNGMSLRDYFAGQALAGMLSNPECITGRPAVAVHAYGYADAMIAAREVKP
jgi:hypothetical protein